MHHTDRGCQYTAAAYREALAARGVTVSMSWAGECLDNAMAESFFATLKAEIADTRVWYNRQRRHSALAYQPPVAFEEEVLLLLASAA